MRCVRTIRASEEKLSNDEMAAACKAIEDGDFDTARHHLNNLSQAGTHPEDVQQLQQLIWRKETAAKQVGYNRIGLALAVSVLGYTALSFQSPAAWGPVVWGLLAFLALPFLVGALAGTSIAGGPKSPRFWRAFWVTSITVTIYSLVGMGITRSRMHSSDKTMDFAIFLVVALIYGAMAGMVAGIAGSALSSSKKAS